MEFNERKYTTLEAINYLMKEIFTIFECIVSNEIGKIKLIRTRDGICFWQMQNEGIIFCEPIELSDKNLRMIWKKIELQN